MRNKWPGTCYRCGHRVEAGKGHFERISPSQRQKWNAQNLHGWLTQHAECAIKYRGTAAHHVYSPALTGGSIPVTDFAALMSAPMGRALLREIEQPGSGKTMTRRPAWKPWTEDERDKATSLGVPIYLDPRGKPTIWQKVRPGDRLWCRETWRTHAMFDHLPPRDVPGHSIHYDADGPVKSGKTRTKIHMPRRFSRITLVVTATKMERVQHIVEADAKAEGVDARTAGYDYSRDERIPIKSHRTGFVYIWQSLHLKPPHRWEDNPECVAVTFVPHLCNVDAMAA